MEADRQREPRRPLLLSFSAFGIFGLWSGCNAVLLADLSRALGLSPGPLGIALLVGAGASIAAMASLGWMADRLGRKTYLVAVTSLFGLGIACLALAGGYPALLLAVLLLFSAAGLYDVGINAVAVDLGRSRGPRLMPFLHAAYSGGAVVGALGSGVLLSWGVGYRSVYLALLLPLASLVAAFVVARFPPPGEPPGERRRGPPPAADRRGLYRHAWLLPIASVAALGFLVEGQMGNWSAIYLRDSLGVGALIGGTGVAAFYGAMVAGRVGTGWLVGRIGERGTLMAAGLLVAAGMALALSTALPALAVGGFLLVGLAVSGVAPVAFSVAGSLAPGRAGGAISVMTTFGYGGFLLGPPLVGGLGEVVGLRPALGVMALAGLAVFALSRNLRKAA